MRGFLRRTFLLALMLLTVGPAFAGQLSVGIRIGPPPAPRAVRSQPRRPGPDYTWIDIPVVG